MPDHVEIAKTVIDDFREIQRYMVKALPNVLGASLTGLDEIKE